MKKTLSLAISFLIVWALVSGGLYLIGRYDADSSFTDTAYCLSIGFSGALGGTFGPIIAAWIGKKLKK